MSDVSTTNLIARAREAGQRASWYKTGEEGLFGALADALEAVTVPTENEREALAEIIAAWHGRHTQANTLPSSAELADAILARSRLPVPVDEIAILRKARSAVYSEFEGKPVPDNAMGAIDRAGRAIGKLINALESVVVPEYDDGTPISFGPALATPVEPEWEYRRVFPSGRPQILNYFDKPPEIDEGWSVERRSVGPWLPVEPVQVDPQPHDSETEADR